MIDRKYPDFLCIGAKKSATSWLRWALNDHPKIWTAPKEVHYFDDSSKDPIIKRYFKFRKKDEIANQLIKYSILSILIYRSFKILRFYYRLLLFERNDFNYCSLFSNNDEKMCGDITPDYAIINDDSILKIKRLNPDIKIIYLLRNPIDRMWSHVAMKVSRFGRPGIKGTDNTTLKKYLDIEK
jgi:hypothetical protein